MVTPAFWISLILPESVLIVLGYNFDELDFHEDNNTAQEDYKLKSQLVKSTSKFKSKKMNALQDKFDSLKGSDMDEFDMFLEEDV